MKTHSHWVVIIGVLGSIASIIGIFFTLMHNGEIQKAPMQNPVQQVYSKDFNKFIPKTYLEKLPRIRYNGLLEGHKYWDTGITSESLKGCNIYMEILFEILINLARAAYKDEYFKGKSVKEYYDEKLSRLMKASRDAQPKDKGTMHILMACADDLSLVEDFIVQVVQDVSEPSDFSNWKKKWDRSGVLGSEGVQFDLDLTSEI